MEGRHIYLCNGSHHCTPPWDGEASKLTASYCLDKPWRHADVADVDRSRDRFGGGLREADFHGSEGAGVIGADRVAGRLACVAVDAARDIDGELLGWMCV